MKINNIKISHFIISLTESNKPPKNFVKKKR